MVLPFCSPLGFRPPKLLLVFLFLLNCIIFTISLVLFYIGLYPFDEAPRIPSWDEAFPLSVMYASTTPNSLPASPSSVKEQLRVVEFVRFIKKSCGAFQGEEPMCVVCLGGLEGSDEVRELGNCRHVFHKECIDQWVDMGQLSCPLCRSKLLPQMT